jgi:outer membrane protein assembly factor BamB
VALSARDGGTVWMAGDDRAAYSSPVLVDFAAGRQIVSLNASSVTAHDPVSGIVLWRYPFPSGQPNVAIPLALGGDRLLVSAGYGVGSKLLQIDPGERGSSRVRLLWESPRLKAKLTNPVSFAGSVFGLDDGRLVCLDPQSGERCGRGARYGHGQTLLVGDLLLVQTEGGEVILVEASPHELRELGRFRAFGGKTWNPPALFGRHLLLRTEAEAALFSLPLAGRPR